MLCGRFPSLCGCSKATSLPFRENLRKPLRPMARHGPSSCGELSSRFLRPELSRQSCFRSSQPGTSFSSLLSSSKTPPSRQHRFFLRDMSGLKDSSTWALLRQQHSSPLCPACWSSRSFNASLCLDFLPDRLRDNNVSTTRYLFTQFLTHRYERHQMTVNRRTTTLLAVAASTALALAGCSTTNTDATGPITLTFSSPAFQDATVKATTDIVDSWNKSNPTIQIKYQKVDPNSVHDKLVTQFAGDSAPDIIQDESSDLAGFTRQGYLADLAALIPDGVKKDIPESVWDAVTYDGKISGVPTIAQVYTLFANTDALTAAGISLPTRDKPGTWDDLATNATKLKPAGDGYGFAWSLKSPALGLMSSGLAFGGQYLSGGTAKPTMAVTDKELEVPKRVKALLDSGVMAPTSLAQSGPEILPGFFAGEEFRWWMLGLLKGTKQGKAANPQTLSISEQSKYKKEAMKFIEYYAKAENIAALSEGDAMIPASKAAAEIVTKKLTGRHGWENILAASSQLVDAPWNKADNFPRFKTEIGNPTFQEYLGGKIDLETLRQRLVDGWRKANE